MNLPSSPLDTPPLVGRDRELAILRDRLAAARAGRGGLVLIGGEAGIGKTALVEALCREAAARGALVLVGRCSEATESSPYGPWKEIAAHYPVSGELPPLPGMLVEECAPGSVTSEAALLRAARGALDALARTRPVLLFIDDLHWADAASINLLRTLARDIPRTALLVLGAYRDDQLAPEDAFAQTLPGLIHECRAIRLALHRLEEADIHTIVAGRYTLPAADGERLGAYLFARAGGNPFFTLELLHTLAEERVLRPTGVAWALGDLTDLRVPDVVRYAVAARVARLDSDTREFLDVVAILGDRCAPALVQAVSGLTERRMGQASERAVAAAMLRPDADCYRFNHPLIQQAIYDGLDPPRRAALHVKAAATIERLYARDLAPYVTALAEQYRRAGTSGDVEKAVLYCVRAAEVATAMFAHTEAAIYYRAALDWLPADDLGRRCDLLLGLGDAQLHAGNPRQIVDEIAGEALAMANRLGDRGRAWRACQVALQAVLALGASAVEDTPMHRIWVERADRYAAPDTTERVRADGDLARVRWAMGQEGDAWALSERALQLARAIGDRETCFAAAWHILDTPWAPRHWRDRFTLAGESVRWNREDLSPRTASHWLTACGRILLDWGERARAEDLWYEREGITRRTGDAQSVVMLSTYRAIRSLLDGHLDRALHHTGRLVTEAAERGMAIRGQQFASIVNARVLIHLGRYDEAVTAIPAARQMAERDASNVTGVASLYAGRLALAFAHTGREAEAMRLLRHFVEDGGVGRSAEETEAPALSLVYFLEAANLLGDTAAGDALAVPLIPLADCATVDMALTCAARHLGAAAALRGDQGQACAYYQQAVGAAGRIGFRPEIALAQLQWAEALLTAGPASADGCTRAKDLLEEAIPALRSMQMRPALDRAIRARQILMPRPARSGNGSAPDRLTAREEEVMRLLASGSTNKEMAQRLSLSTRTVERHIANIYTKIGAHGRAEAIAYALRRGLDPL